MAETLRDLWQTLALDGIGDLIGDARPGLVVTADGRRPLFANAAGRRFLALAPDAGLDAATLDPRLVERLARFAERAAAGAVTRELLRFFDGLKPTLLAFTFRRPTETGPIVVTVETAATVAADARPEASLAGLLSTGAMIALFDGEGDVVCAQGDHTAAEGLDDALDRLLDAAETSAVVEQRVAVGGGHRDIALVTLGPARDARRLLWIGARIAASPEAESADVASTAAAESAAPVAAFVEAPTAAEPEIETPAVEAAAEAPIDAPAATLVTDRAEVEGAAPPADTSAAGEDFDDSLFVAAAPLALDAWDDDGEADAAWTAHATATPAAAVPVVAEADAVSTAPELAIAEAPSAIETSAAEAPTSDLVTDADPISATEAAIEPDATAPESAEIAPLVASVPEPHAEAATEASLETETTAEAPTAVALPARTDTDGFAFVPTGHAVKFVWFMDAERRFTMVSPELAEVVGPAVSRLVGRPWFEVAQELGFDGDGRIAEALARRDTWSGRTVLWPVEGEALRIPVDLAALPAFDRRVFTGFRGFGTCRADEPVPDPTGTGLRLRSTAPAAALLPAPTTAEAATPEPQAYPDDAEVALLVDHAEASIDESTEAAFAGEIADAAPAEVVAAAPVPVETVEPVEPVAEVAADVITATETPAPDAPAAPSEPVAAPIEEPKVSPEMSLPPASTEATPPSTRPVERTTAETAAIAAAVAAFTAAGAPKTGPARAEGPTPPAALSGATDRVLTLARRTGDTPADSTALSQPERIAFRRIAEALGARVEGDAHAPQDAAPPTAEAPVAEAPIAEAPIAESAVVEPPVITTEPTVEATTEAEADDIALWHADATAADTPVEPAASEAPAPIVAAPVVVETSSPVVAEAPAPIFAAVVPAAEARLLDRLPLAVAVIKDDTVAYANDRFLSLLRYPDLATLEAAGGLDSLFAGEHVARRWEATDAGRPMPLIAHDGTLVPADASLASVPWGDGQALMMTLTEVAPVLAAPVAAVAETVEPEIAAPVAPALAEVASNVVTLPTAAQPTSPQPMAPALAAVPPAPSAEAERIAELEAIVDTATDGVLMLDGDGRVLSANTAAEVLFGTARHAMVGRPLAERLAPESRRSALDYLDGLARNGVASVLNDGREVIGAVEPEGLIPLFMTIGSISSGPTKKYCAVLRDIAQWKKAEEDLTTARRRAEEASVHKSDFLAKISHEIRTPLNAIIGFSELMMDERFGPIGNERYKDYLRDIHVSGSHIMSLVNDLLDLSKVEAGKMDLRFEAVTLTDIVTECVAMMQPQANRERIIIRSSLPAGVPPVVADPRSVRQVVLNLLSNAIKFTPAGGQVIVSTTLEDNGEVVLRVRDTGYGMTDKEMQTAMEPFRQLHTTRSRAGGTGLGLPLTKALVEANRAVFRIDSTVGQGTLVSIAFPVTRVLAS